MTAEQVVVAVLQTDATLSSVLTGSIYADLALVDAVSENGINRRDTPDAFDDNGYLLPCARVRGRGQYPFPAGTPHADLGAQWTATREVVEVHLYQAYGWDAVTAARERIYTLLHGKRYSGLLFYWLGDSPLLTEPSLSNASHLRCEFAAIGCKS